MLFLYGERVLDVLPNIFSSDSSSSSSGIASTPYHSLLMGTWRFPSCETILLVRQFDLQSSLQYEQIVAARSVGIHRGEVHPHHSLVVVLEERVVREDVGECGGHVLDGSQMGKQVDIRRRRTISIEEVGLLL